MSKQTTSNTSVASQLDLNGLTTAQFLQQYWQKKPCVIRQGFKNLQSPISANELAGLACEEHINSRLVIENLSSDSDKAWQLEFGPFDEERFSSLPESNWSLLVSDVERHFPDSRFLLDAFRFIPDWRIDDLMISYAPEGGSVGAHTDAYDVFLIQLSGQRQWKISEDFDTSAIPDIDLCILKNFSAEQEWILEAGDILYLPPHIAHHGIAQAHQDDCMTASVGFRAPSLKTISNEYLHFLNERFSDEQRYRDKTPAPAEHHAEITDDTVSHFIEHIKKSITTDPALVKQWLGQYSSDNKAFEEIINDYSDIDTLETIDQLDTLIAQQQLAQSPYSRFLFSSNNESNQNMFLFVDGETYTVTEKFALCLCDEREIDMHQLAEVMTDSDRTILLSLYNNGSVIIAKY